MIAPIDKIKSLLNDDIVSLFGDDVINNAYLEAYKSTLALISDEFVLEDLSNSSLERKQYFTTHSNNTNSDALYSTVNFADNRRLLSVARKNTHGDDYDGIYYEAIKIPTIHGKTKAVNVSSIFYENDRWNPKYYIDEYGKIVILPLNYIALQETHPQAQLFFITFPDFNQAAHSSLEYTFSLVGKNFSTVGKLEEGTLFYGIPGGAKELFYTDMALNLLQNYMADFIYDEEDQELVNLAKDHAAALLQKKQDQVNFVALKYSNKRKA